MTMSLLPLSAFLAEQPGIQWLPSQEGPSFVARGAHVRWNIQREISNVDTGAEYTRTQELAKLGISANEEDSKEFALSLVEALSDHLTPRNLKHLVEAFTAEYDRQRNDLERFTAKLGTEAAEVK